ncbi:MAG: glycosyltransferase family 2 protein [Candidatus Falkowbacteria bacterium]|nr:glycosyltransferase family 2 protein [Candidatus Falkowbacteria bacterium]
MNYLKIGKATELQGKDRVFYRILEILPGFLSLFTLFILIILSYFKPVWVAYFLIAFDVYWLLLVLYLAIYLVVSFIRLKKGSKINWEEKCHRLAADQSGLELNPELAPDCLARQGVKYSDLWQVIILPVYQESLDILRTCLSAIINDSWPKQKIILVLAMEARAGAPAYEKAKIIEQEFSHYFKYFLLTFHPGDIVGELKGKGANQAWAMKEAKAKIIDAEGLAYDKILVNVFDIDTVVSPGYFHVLAYKFLTVTDPYRASYQPIPVYHNNIWEAPFFSRLAASSNTFWQMMMQIREEKLVTYSSHSMTFKALVDIGFWSTNNVSEDSRIFWECLLYYNGNYRVEPLYHTVSMDVTLDQTSIQTARNLYKQQRRWAWGVESIPYLIFNMVKRWSSVDRKKLMKHILIQIYGFHSWSTSALIIAVIGWLPMLLGGDRFNATVLSINLPVVSRNLMNLAMVGMILSALISSLLLPKRPRRYKISKNILMALEWVFVPVTIVIFGAIPCLDAQIRLMFGKYMGFFVTPKARINTSGKISN